MPILTQQPDPRMQVFLDFVSVMQQQRRREEEERAAEREAQSRRAWTIPATVIGAVAGGIGGAAIGGAAGAVPTATIAGMGGAGAVGGATAGGILGGALLGGGMGAQVGGALADEDYGAAVQGITQGVATIANLPALQRQGISPLEAAMGGVQGIPDILQDARTRRRQDEYLGLRDTQIGRRQQETLVQREASARRLKNEKLQQMPPHLRAQYATADQRRLDQERAFRMGEFGDPNSPEAQDALAQANRPNFLEMDQALEWEPPPPEPLADRVKRESLFDPRTGHTWYISKGDLKLSKGNPATDTEIQTQIAETAENLEETKKQEQIAIFQRGRMAQGESEEKALKKATKSVEGNAALLAQIRTNAQAQAEQIVASRSQRWRSAQAQPTPEEQAQQQEAAEQQQLQQQQGQQQAAQEQQVEQAKAFFSRSAQALVDIGQKHGADPKKWPVAKQEEARAPAEGFLATLPVLVPLMSLEEKQSIKQLVILAKAIVDLPQRLGVQDEPQD